MPLAPAEMAVAKKYVFCCKLNAKPCACISSRASVKDLQTPEEQKKFDILTKPTLAKVGGLPVDLPHFSKDKKNNEVWLVDTTASKCPAVPAPNTCACFVVEYDAVNNKVVKVYTTDGNDLPQEKDDNPVKPFFETDYKIDRTKFGYFLFCLELTTRTVGDKTGVVCLKVI
jgi:hypothetical protein